jgi:hypothetical protein
MKWGYEKVDKFAIPILIIMAVVSFLMLCKTFADSENRRHERKCYDCDLMYDPIGLEHIVKTNCVQRPCLEGE